MQIVIPMSGFGERFRRAGYAVPKPLIEVDGKPIIAHVVDLFPGDHDFIFICNSDHLAEPSYRMAEILRAIAPKGRIVPIGPHKLGPVNAVLQAAQYIDLEAPTVVNYCDFTCYWDFEDFAAFVRETDCDGCVPAYKGFHPHSLGSTFYAYMRQQGLWMEDIQEKQPFTDQPLEEYASSGTYYFRSGALCLDMFRKQMEQQLEVNGEYYASLAYKVLAREGGRIAIYQLQHFMQWGTPQDLADYLRWSSIFRRLTGSDGRQARHHGAILLPMAGEGRRFAEAGYALPKPLVPVSGRPMVVQAMRDLPSAPVQTFVLRQNLPGVEAIERKLRATFVGARFRMLEALTEGQAITCQFGAEELDPKAPVTIGACDNGMLYNLEAFERAIDEDSGADVLVWVIRGHADGERRPTMFGWVDADAEGRVTGVRVKQVPEDPKVDPMIIGTFTFRRLGDFQEAANRLVARDGRVNGEFYVDSLIEDCVDMGLNVRLFEIDYYIGWGTPIDLQTFEYWQSCFHKWKSHPYRLEKDARVPSASIPALLEQYRAAPAPRPEGTPAPVAPASPSPIRRLAQAIGIGAR
ncbi:NTP transferase domain-containing protein [Sphingomonas sp. HITSZ_GF]|uniref:NTP transferase domain-containing protein n=1 Tax=Sphingomonas sp. HITSZ_GF TaxID=3037247 RepID=UPI00240E0035|nr:NTP transferase domain-containing protein [Sphingomonas sp. HITSZ_GF]MDG2535761.1 NTP transferase domain-containing protein [Sphingomonas sp. HITSZ_GF]